MWPWHIVKDTSCQRDLSAGSVGFFPIHFLKSGYWILKNLKSAYWILIVVIQSFSVRITFIIKHRLRLIILYVFFPQVECKTSLKRNYSFSISHNSYTSETIPSTNLFAVHQEGNMASISRSNMVKFPCSYRAIFTEELAIICTLWVWIIWTSP